MKRILRFSIVTILFFASLPIRAQAAELLIPVGRVIGLQLQDDTVTVAAFDDSLGSLARDAGLKIGDEIVKVGNIPVDCAQDVRCALDSCSNAAELTVRRNGKLSTLEITPRQTDDGPRIGVYLRQGIAGIGTVTFYDPETGAFGTLGHGVSDAGGTLIHMKQGNAYEAAVLSVRKGRCGEPGQLKGCADEHTFGTLLRNTPHGVFGITKTGWKGEPMPVAAFEEVTTGPAWIRSTVSGSTVREYSVEIMKIYPKDRSDGRNFLIKVTDPDLLEATGGIVQGMSGSPICQNGKIVGAVTHVLVNDPTMGYGIFIENMLDAAA